MLLPGSLPALRKEDVVKKLRLATVTALSSLAVGAGMILPSSAQAAPTYWQFQNSRFGTCLTAGDSGSAYATVCQGWNRQQWDWIGDGAWYKQLRNRETGKCLMTDAKSDINAVWTSDCNSSATGQMWYYDSADFELYANVGGVTGGYLRTSDIKDAVYTSQRNTSIADSYYTWFGTHN
jgi:hypothetical protein